MLDARWRVGSFDRRDIAPIEIHRRSQSRILHHLYDENFSRLIALFPCINSFTGEWLSKGGSEGDLSILLLARDTHTAVVKLTHRQNALSTPDAFVRVYFDLRQAEVTHFERGAELRKLFAPTPDARSLLARRLRLNQFFSKWLDFLADAGHHSHSWQPTPV